MTSKKRIDERTRKTLGVLYGGEVPKKVPQLLMLIAEVIDHPMKLPSRIEQIVKDEKIEDHRYHLVRIQLESELRIREDVDRHTSRLWVAQTIEKIAFGDLLVDGQKPDEDDEEED